MERPTKEQPDDEHTGRVSSRAAGGAAPLIRGDLSALPSGARAFRDGRSLEERLTDASQTGMAAWLDPAQASGEVMWPARTVLVALVGAACVGMLAGAALIHAHGTLARAFS